MPTSSVLVGSQPSIPAATITVVANAVSEALAFAGGNFYYDHNTGSLSLLTQFVAMLNSHSELVGSAAICTRSLRTRLTNAVAFSVDWGSDTTVRDLLGFAANLVSATAHVSTLVSPLLWAAGKPESSAARQGSDGLLVKDTYAGRSAPGVVVATENNTWRRNAFSWRYVLIDLVEQVPDVGGTYATFWDRVLSRFRRFWVSRDRTYDSADTTTSIALTSSRIPSSGAYIHQQDGPMERPHVREIANIEHYCTIELPVESALEYGA